MAEIKKTFLSVDGNTATALASYNFTEVASISQLLRLQLWQNWLTNMLLKAN